MVPASAASTTTASAISSSTSAVTFSAAPTTTASAITLATSATVAPAPPCSRYFHTVRNHPLSLSLLLARNLGQPDLPDPPRQRVKVDRIGGGVPASRHPFRRALCDKRECEVSIVW